MSTKTGSTTFQHTFINDALGNDDAVALAEKLKRQEVSAQQLTKAAIDRANLINPKLSAITFLAQVDQIPSKKTPNIQINQNNERFFEGIPTFLKDNINYGDMPTAFGTNAFSPKTYK